jgi:tetratricopeptide (TPR) repeat protein
MDTQQHYDPETLIEFAEGTSVLRDEITAHAAACGNCAREINEHREMIDALRDPEVWRPQRPAPAPKPERIAVLATFKQRLDDEDSAANKVLDEVMKGPSAWWTNAVRKSGLRTAGLIRQLLGRMRTVADRTLADALILTTVANEIAESVTVTDYPSDFVITLRAQALRDHAWVLSASGRFREALSFADRAERLLLQTPIPDYELARLDLVRTGIYRFTDRADEAITLSRRAASTFERFGDRRMFVTARLYEGAMLFARNEYAPALDAWKSIDGDPSIADQSTRIMVQQNIGLCYRELGRIDEAIEALTMASAEWELLGSEVKSAECRWSLATTVASAGRHENAITLFRSTWTEFERLGMEAHATLSALELAEALLIVGRTDEVPAICRTLIDRFTRAGMGGSAMTALAFLRETVATGHATPALVRHVHEFLRDVSRREPDSLVQPVLRLEE